MELSSLLPQHAFVALREYVIQIQLAVDRDQVASANGIFEWVSDRQLLRNATALERSEGRLFTSYGPSLCFCCNSKKTDSKQRTPGGRRGKRGIDESRPTTKED